MCLYELGLVVTPFRRMGEFWSETSEECIFIEATVLEWYDVRTETNRRWHVGSGSVAMLTTGADVVEMAMSVRWDNNVGMRWVW